MKFIKYCPLAIILLFLSKPVFSQIVYPSSPSIPVIDVYHDTEIIDNYQWLENQEGPKVSQWVDDQNSVSEKYLKRMLNKSSASLEMNKYMYSDVDFLRREKRTEENRDKRYFRLYYVNNYGTPDIFYKYGATGKYVPYLRNAMLSSAGNINISNLRTSKNNDYLAVQYNQNGSDWNDIKIVKIEDKLILNDLVENTKFSNINWYKNGFFYTEYPNDSINAKTIFPKIRYHLIGNSQSKDQVIIQTRNSMESLDLYSDETEEIYVIKKENPESNSYSYYYYEPVTNNIRFRPFLKDIKYELYIRGFKKDLILARTSMDSKQLLVAIDPKDPGNWKILSPSYENAILTGQEILDDKVLLSYHGEVNDFIIAVDYEGKVLNELSITPGLSVSSMDFNKDSKRFIYTVESYTIPQVLYKLDLDKFTSELYDKTKVNFDFKDYKFRKTTFKSHDGVEVPIFIVFKDELKTDGNTPFLLKTYGGYGVIGTPRYDPGIVYFLENNGAFAYVNVRGGGKLGNSWWVDGKNLKKKNAFLDFIGASEFLIEKGYTSPKKIAITGGSHGGLVMGAAITMRPDLYGSAAIDVGALDMLRFENFTIGATNTNLSEFGSVKNEDEFKNLLSYSPYHNIDYTIPYPSTLIMTGKYDNRVPPLHSYKFTALMQNNPNQKNPILLWTQDKTGHYGASNIEDKLLENSYKYGFLLNELK